MFLSILHCPGLVMATPSSFAWRTLKLTRILKLTRTRAPSTPTWRTSSPASTWRSATRTCCSTSCPHTPAAWLVPSMCWPTTMRSWASLTSLCHRPLWTRWGEAWNWDESISISQACWLMLISAKLWWNSPDVGYSVNRTMCQSVSWFQLFHNRLHTVRQNTEDTRESCTSSSLCGSSSMLTG